MSFGKSRARLLSEDQVSVTFADVAGVDEAKEEVAEIVDFLKDPSEVPEARRQDPEGRADGRQPRHRQDAARACDRGRGQGAVLHDLGSDFVEMFVGVGASRVRDMFEQAKKHAPCIVFIDEIDAVGRHRGAGLGGGHDEREQTLNQLLVEMDGFEGNEGVIVIAATNRPDVLDPALLRPRPLRPSGRRAAARRARSRADPQGTHAQGPDRRGRTPVADRARHAGILGRGPHEPRQ
jgi:cell division protease FtsH